MITKIEKGRGNYQLDNRYSVSIQVNNNLTKEEYKDIIDAIESISKIIDPMIDHEINIKEKLKGGEKK